MDAEPAGEQAIPVRVVDRRRLRGARPDEAAGHHPAPQVEVALRVPDEGRPPTGARRSVQAHDLVQRYGQHAVRVRLPQVGLGGRGQPRQVVEGQPRSGVDPGRRFLPQLQGNLEGTLRTDRHLDQQSRDPGSLASAANPDLMEHKDSPQRWPRGRPPTHCW